MDADGSGQGLRQNQKKEKIRKEFEKHEDNPFNQVTVSYDASKDEIKQIKERERSKIETRLGQEWISTSLLATISILKILWPNE